MTDTSRALLELMTKMEQLFQFQDRLNPDSSILRIWELFQEDLGNIIDTDACALFLVNEESREFVLTDAVPPETADDCQREITLQIEKGLFAAVIGRRHPALIPPLSLSTVATALLLPFSTVRRTLGVALVISPLPENTITQEHNKLLSLLTRQCSLVMENALLYERLRKEHQALLTANREIRLLSRTDPLTGSFNRGYLNERLPQELKRALRYRHPLSIILCDIDHFKNLNDTWGHPFGDEVLKGFAACITRLIRKDIDWLARYGGEEFLVVLPETESKGALLHAERLRQAIADLRFDSQGEAVGITASFGVATLDAGRRRNPAEAVEDLIREADDYLYQAKGNGRDRVAGQRL
jgi:diguanylate cyclase (GGDEF)-like protein